MAGEGVVSRVRTEATSTGSRVSLDVDGRAWRRAFSMHDPYRIVVDLARHPPGVSSRGPRTVGRVVLDPGHGGTDTGAVGPGGLKEKDVTLDVALEQIVRRLRHMQRRVLPEFFHLGNGKIADADGADFPLFQ